MRAKRTASAVQVVNVSEVVAGISRGLRRIEVERRSIAPAAHHLRRKQRASISIRQGVVSQHLFQHDGFFAQELAKRDDVLFQLTDHEKTSVARKKSWRRHRRHLAALGAVAEDELAERNFAEPSILVRIAGIARPAIIRHALHIRIADAVHKAEMLEAGAGAADDERRRVLAREEFLHSARHLCGELRAVTIQIVRILSITRNEEVQLRAAPWLIPMPRIAVPDVAEKHR